MSAPRLCCSCPSLFQMSRSLRNLLMWSKYLQVHENTKVNARRVKYFASVSNRSVLCRVKRHLNAVMDAELLVQRIANKISPEPIRRQARRRLLQPLIRNASVFKGNGGRLWVARSRGSQQICQVFHRFHSERVIRTE